MGNRKFRSNEFAVRKTNDEIIETYGALNKSIERNADAIKAIGKRTNAGGVTQIGGWVEALTEPVKSVMKSKEMVSEAALEQHRKTQAELDEAF